MLSSLHRKETISVSVESKNNYVIVSVKTLVKE